MPVATCGWSFHEPVPYEEGDVDVGAQKAHTVTPELEPSNGHRPVECIWDVEVLDQDWAFGLL
jgi:hypothetical protein